MNNGRKYALVTGISSGVGKCVAEILYSREYTVLGISRNTHNDSKYKIFTCDLSNIDQVREVIKRLEKYQISLFIFAAAVSYNNKFEEDDMKKIYDLFSVNLLSSLFILKDLCLSNDRGYSVYSLFVSSTSSLKPICLQQSYCASKIALNYYFRSIYDELKEKNIYSSLLIPSAINTNFWSKEKRLKKGQKMLSPDYVAQIALKGLFNKQKYIKTGIIVWFQQFIFSILPWSVTDYLISLRKKIK